MTGETLIELRDAEVVRDRRTILHVESLAFREGEHVAVLGPNGAGKSTLIGLLTRDVRPVVRDEPPVLLRGLPRWDLFEARRIFGVVSDNLQEAHRKRVTVRDVVLSGHFGSVGLYRRSEVTPAMTARAGELLDYLGITALADRTMDTLSTGEARRALIGRALVHEPALLVLDEPTHGLDPSGTHHFLSLLRTIASRCALVIVTHHVSDIVPEVGRVVMLKDGVIFRDGPKAALLTGEAVGELYGIPAQIEEREGWYRLW
ncbi:MAG: ATP-binding cassette domain-containing protein [Coriobacteriia bacterium]|nr:ATP-binding cassette domain-containing protein [Coriobacteriia bacterium]MBN2839816.1 ATP-binding cassette domain-containing protein [Coriobacteriia bacterium]